MARIQDQTLFHGSFARCLGCAAQVFSRDARFLSRSAQMLCRDSIPFRLRTAHLRVPSFAFRAFARAFQ